MVGQVEHLENKQNKLWFSFLLFLQWFCHLCFLWSLYFQREHKLAGNKRPWAHDLVSVTGSVRKAPSSTQLTGHAGWKRRASATCTCTHLYSLLEKLGGAETSLNICLQIASGFSFKRVGSPTILWKAWLPSGGMQLIARTLSRIKKLR